MINWADIIGYLGIIISALSQLMLSPIIVLRMGISGLGVWHLLFHTFTYLRFIDTGLSNSIVRGIAENDSKGNQQQLDDFFVTSRLCLTLAGIFFTICGVCACFILPDFINIPASLAIDFLISLLLISTWGFFRYHYYFSILKLRGLNKLIEFNSINLLEGGGRPALAALFIFLQPSLICLAAGYVVIEILSRIIAEKIAGSTKFIGKFNKKELMKIVTFGGAASIISITTLLLFYGSSFIVGRFLGVDAIAAFQSSIALPYLIARFGFIPFQNKVPGLIIQYQTGDQDQLRICALNSHIKLLSSAAVLLFIACFINKKFVSIWVGEQLYVGDQFTVIYSIFIFLNLARHNGYMMWQIKDDLTPMLFCHMIEIPLNIVLSIVFAKHYGIVGIAYAFLLAHIPATIISQIPFWQRKWYIGPVFQKTNYV